MPKPTRSALGPWQRFLVRILIVGGLLLTGTGLFLFFSDGAGSASSISLLIHIFGGTLLVLVMIGFVVPHAVAQRKRRPSIRATGFTLLTAFLLVIGTGFWPIFEEVASRRAWARGLHIGGAVAALFLYFVHRRGGINPLKPRRYIHGLATCALLGFVLFAWDRLDPEGFIQALGAERKENQFTPTRLPGNRLVSVDEVDDSAGCIDCHKVITEEWERSAHRHSSMTNPFYMATIVEMREKVDLEKTQFCSGCHDPALLFTGLMDQEELDYESRAARTGLSCVACHTIDVEDGTRGNGDYLFKPRKIYAWERSNDPKLREAHAVLLRLKPEAHKESLRPHNLQSSEFCATCHIAEISPMVNNWKFMRAQSEYDAWHASGVSMNNARSFYHPPAAKNCQDCHMPKVLDPEDPTSDKDGYVRSHMFGAANTALPYLRGDDDMIDRIQSFLRTACRIDISALEVRKQGAADNVPPVRAVPASALSEPVEPGDIVEAHVVVRTLNVGHRFPGGTIDSNEVWIEFRAQMGDDEPFFVSGRVDPETGIVDQQAEFYRAWVADKDGNRVVNRLGTDVRTRVYVKTIPPGAADVARYRFRVPEGAKGKLKLSARLRYRKFMREYVDFVFPNSKLHTHRFNDGSTHTADVTKIPITDMAETERSLELGASNAMAFDWKKDYQRVNDLGIAYLIQGDTVHAEAAFNLVTENVPDYADGWVNLGRVMLQRRKFEETITAVNEALKRREGYPKALWLQGEVQRARGAYDRAEASYKAVLETFPEDRVVLENLGLVLWEQDKAQEAVTVLKRLLKIDEANPQAWFHLLNCYKQLGDEEGMAHAEEMRDYYRTDRDEHTRRGEMLLKHDLVRLSRPIHVHRQEGL